MLTKREKQRYQRKWYRKRRMTWIKENGPCAECGSWNNLEVDHIDPLKKEFPVGQVWSRREEIRKKELAKCQVLCEECHNEKTIRELKELKRGAFADDFKPASTVLSEEDVIKIKKRLKKGESQSSIAKDFPVSRHAITKINTGKRWPEVKV